MSPKEGGPELKVLGLEGGSVGGLNNVGNGGSTVVG